MMIFIQNVPKNTLPFHIDEFVAPALKRLFFTDGIVHSVLMIHKDNRHHAILTVDSEKTGQRLIKKLNKSTLRGKIVNIREYFIRSWHNDQRIRNIPVTNNRRVQDRRK